MTNYRFNLEEWLPLFPFEPDADHFRGTCITSPCHICNNELLRREMQNQFIWGPSVPVDIFIMAEGEPADRHVTKVGGLPYRPAGAMWPKSQDGKPMYFVAQFNFSNSRDITGDLPGDLLLVFVADTFDSVIFEWQRPGIADLMTVEEIPTPLAGLDPCYGHIFRTVSYPQAKCKTSGDPLCRGKDVWSDYWLPQYQAMQIGSAPFFIQGDPKLPGRLLCTICSVGPDLDKHFPWINHPEPLPEQESSFDCNYLMIGDTGCVYISIDDDNQLHWSASSFGCLG